MTSTYVEHEACVNGGDAYHSLLDRHGLGAGEVHCMDGRHSFPCNKEAARLLVLHKPKTVEFTGAGRRDNGR